MDKTQRTNDLVSAQLALLADDAQRQAAEIRALDDQELVLCGGGDGNVCW